MSPQPLARAFQVHVSDNVATLLGDAAEDVLVTVVGPAGESMLHTREKILLGHKIALNQINPNQSIYKFGVEIGVAICGIEAGSWVHLHNCRSQVDERSNSLDVHTGVPKGAHNG